MRCLASKYKALMLSQLLRLLKSEDLKSINHIGYWMGDLLEDFVTGLGWGQHAQTTPEYFNYVAGLLVEAQIGEIITSNNWTTVTCRQIYWEHAKSLPVPKVETEAGVCYKLVWSRLASPVLSSAAREVVFLLIHNKLQVKERMFRIGKFDDPYCDECPGSVTCDVEHFFCSCAKVAHLWRWLKGRLVTMAGDCFLLCSNWELINLLLPRSRTENEAVWLIRNYIYWVWFEKTS